MLNLFAKSFPAVFVLFASLMPAQNATELWSRGYAVIPTPRSVKLSGGDVQIDGRWVIVPASIDSQEISVRTLRRDLAEWYRLNLNAAPQRDAVIRLFMDSFSDSYYLRREPSEFLMFCMYDLR